MIPPGSPLSRFTFRCPSRPSLPGEGPRLQVARRWRTGASWVPAIRHPRPPRSLPSATLAPGMSPRATRVPPSSTPQRPAGAIALSRPPGNCNCVRQSRPARSHFLFHQVSTRSRLSGTNCSGKPATSGLYAPAAPGELWRVQTAVDTCERADPSRVRPYRARKEAGPLTRTAPQGRTRTNWSSA